MKRYSLIYKLSFLPYLGLFITKASGFSEIFAVAVVFVFVLLAIPSFVYQLIYILKLGRRDNVSAKKVLGSFFFIFSLP